MFKEIKILFMILILVVFSFLDGLLILKNFGGGTSVSSIEQKKEKEVQEKLLAINTALNYLSQKKTSKEFSPTISPNSSPSAQLKISDLSAQIYNASGISGLANTLKDKLTGLNIYQTIDTSNLETTTSSSLKFNSRVPENIRTQTKSIFNLNNFNPEIPSTITSEADFILILGSDFKP